MVGTTTDQRPRVAREVVARPRHRHTANHVTSSSCDPPPRRRIVTPAWTRKAAAPESPPNPVRTAPPPTPTKGGRHKRSARLLADRGPTPVLTNGESVFVTRPDVLLAMLGETDWSDIFVAEPIAPERPPPLEVEDATHSKEVEEPNAENSTVEDADDGIAMRSPVDVDALFHKHIELADSFVHEACRRTGKRLEIELLVSAARQGLWRAARRFDADRGVPFEIFARGRIAGAIFDEFRSERLLWRSREKQHASPELGAMLGACSYAVKPEELHDETDIVWLTSWRATIGVRTLPAGGTLSLSGLVDDDSRLPPEQLERAELLAAVQAAIAALDPQKRALVEGVYYRELSMEAACDATISRSWASRLHGEALEELRRAMIRGGWLRRS
jgi:RNA polymerase sigma factor for flagellar operon FliA